MRAVCRKADSKKIKPEKLEEFKQLKDQAWKDKKASNGTLSHAQALNQLAVARGFKNWSMLALNWRATS